ncbi:LanC-like protein 2 [Phlyctochytrium bullatum]|nr:LanC-like protein 2 [Phlyctochytrium bullatum]
MADPNDASVETLNADGDGDVAMSDVVEKPHVLAPVIPLHPDDIETEGEEVGEGEGEDQEAEEGGGEEGDEEAAAAKAAEVEAVKKTARHLPNPYFGKEPSDEAEMGPSEEITRFAREKLVELAKKVKEEFDALDHSAPADVYHGHAGIALLFLKIFIVDPGFTVNGTSALSIAKEYIQSALQAAHAKVTEEEKDGVKNYKCGFIGSRAGVYAIAAAVYHQLGSKEESATAVKHLADMKKSCLNPVASCELFYGKPGYLYALLFVRRALGDELAEFLGASASLVEAVTDAVLADGRQGAKRTFSPRFERDRQHRRQRIGSPLAWSWHMECYVGAAHGTAGSLASLLMVPKVAAEMGVKSEDEIKAEEEAAAKAKAEEEAAAKAKEEEEAAAKAKAEAEAEAAADAAVKTGKTEAAGAEKTDDMKTDEGKKEGKDGVKEGDQANKEANGGDRKDDRGNRGDRNDRRDRRGDRGDRRDKRPRLDDVRGDYSEVLPPPKTLKEEIKRSVSFILKKQVHNGNYAVRVNENLSVSPQLYEGDELVQFCHGSPGIVFFLIKAYEAFHDEEYLKRAEAAAESVWERGVLRKGVGLCHGVSGNAFVFLALYRHTHKPRDFWRAHRFLDLALRFEELEPTVATSPKKEPAGPPGMPESVKKATQAGAKPRGLLEGLAGVALLAAEIGYWGWEKEGYSSGWVGTGGFPCFTDL